MSRIESCVPEKCEAQCPVVKLGRQNVKADEATVTALENIAFSEAPENYAEFADFMLREQLGVELSEDLKISEPEVAQHMRKNLGQDLEHVIREIERNETELNTLAAACAVGPLTLRAADFRTGTTYRVTICRSPLNEPMHADNIDHAIIFREPLE